MVVTKLTQEVAVVSAADGGAIDFERYALGSAVRVLVNHSCMTAAMFEVYHVTAQREAGGARAVVDAWRPCKWW
jgi:D-serine deaminase-like pyridoxal phosphate-dependent protein